MNPLKLVVHFKNGKVLKGTTENFNPTSPSFHLLPIPACVDGTSLPVLFAELKAVFIVRDFVGKKARVERQTFDANSPGAGGAKMKITFRDGEVLLGRSLNYDPGATGFFVFPADGDSNNLRVFVVTAAVKDVKQVA